MTTSRYFETIEAQPGGGIAATTAITSAANGRVEAHLRIDEPQQILQEYVDRADSALDYFEQLDARIRATILRDLSHGASVPMRVYEARCALEPEGSLSPQQFTDSLRAVSVTISPAEGSRSPDRVKVTYASRAQHIEQRFSAVIREGEGLVFADAEPSGDSELPQKWSPR